MGVLKTKMNVVNTVVLCKWQSGLAILSIILLLSVIKGIEMYQTYLTKRDMLPRHLLKSFGATTPTFTKASKKINYESFDD